MRIPLPLAAALLAAPACAATVEDEQLWMLYAIVGNHGRLAYHAEVQPRIGDGISYPQQVLIRPALGYRISDKVTLYQGYVHVVLPRRGARDPNEERSFQQLSWSLGQVAGGALSSRTRLEQRWLSNGRDTGWRVREFVRWARPLQEGRRTKALVWVEPFFHLNDTDWGARAGLDQIRTFVGVELPLPRGRSTLEAGYLSQVVNAAGGTTRVNHIVSLSLWVRP